MSSSSTTHSTARTRSAGDRSGGLEAASTAALATTKANISDFGIRFPHHATVDGVYPLKSAEHGEPLGGNTSWTTGFWPGMLWLASDMSEDPVFAEAAVRTVPSFVDRADRRVDLDHHDMGFLYTLACVPAWRKHRDSEARRASLIAADHLMARVLEPSGIVQAWGDLSDPEQRGRAIIDSLMNMPLLYWASATTGDPRYEAAAVRHARQLARHIVREDDTTFHTFYWDVMTGEPTHGATDQGFADDSCWARGQAWGIYGFALNYLWTGDDEFLSTARRCADYFLTRLPADSVPFWDLVFGDGSGHLRDSSSGAIAACGLMELADLTGIARYREAAHTILDSLMGSYTPADEERANCLLAHGVYHWHAKIGMDEGNLWGDYFYLEALVRRQNPAWESFWHPCPLDLPPALSGTPEVSGSVHGVDREVGG